MLRARRFCLLTRYRAKRPFTTSSISNVPDFAQQSLRADLEGDSGEDFAHESGLFCLPRRARTETYVESIPAYARSPDHLAPGFWLLAPY